MRRAGKRAFHFWWGQGIADDVPALAYYLVLSLAPFVLGFSDESTPTIFFIVVGLGEIVAALATRWHPEDDLAAERHRPGRSEPLNS